MRSLPPKHQTLLFSATMPSEVESLANDYLKHPVKVKARAPGTACGGFHCKASKKKTKQ